MSCHVTIRRVTIIVALSTSVFASSCRGRAVESSAPADTSSPSAQPTEPTAATAAPVKRSAGPFRIGAPASGAALCLPDAARHRGIVIRTNPGAFVQAACDGKITFITESYPGIGPAIVIEHAGGYRTVYGPVHARRGITESTPVRRGERIGRLVEPNTLLRFRLMRGDTDVPNIFEFADFESTGDLHDTPRSDPGS